jgi:glycosyl transferase family 87
MHMRARRLVAPAAVALLGVLALAIDGLRTMAFTDYEIEAEPALLALRHGDALGFLHHLPPYGGSLVLRAPFALLPAAWQGGDLALFRTMAVPCLLAAAALAVVLFARARALGAGQGAAWLALVVVAFNPLTLRALEIGHPEELLGGALCVAAALAAGARRPLLAGVLVGLAVANKPWAVVAVLPVLLVLPAGRRQALAAAAGTAALVLGPMLLLSDAAASGTVAVAHVGGAIFNPWQVWWFLGEHGPLVMGTQGEHVGYRTPPVWATQLSHPLAVLVPIALCLAVARRRRALSAAEGLALLALCLHLRCLFDTWNTSYYAVPALMALAAWEIHRRRPPLVTLAVTLTAWVTFELLPRAVGPDGQSIGYMAWSVPLAGALAVSLLWPTAWIRITARFTEVVRRQLPTLAAVKR